MSTLAVSKFNLSQRAFSLAMAVGFFASFMGWLYNLYFARAYFAGVQLSFDPGDRPLQKFLTADYTTISTGLFLLLFACPLYSAIRYRRNRVVVSAYPRSLFFLCTNAGLAGTLVGIMICFYAENTSTTPLEQAQEMFARMSVGIPTAILSTLVGILIPAIAFFFALWFHAAFGQVATHDDQLTAFFENISLANAAIVDLTLSLRELRQLTADLGDVTKSLNQLAASIGDSRSTLADQSVAIREAVATGKKLADLTMVLTERVVKVQETANSTITAMHDLPKSLSDVVEPVATEFAAYRSSQLELAEAHTRVLQNQTSKLKKARNGHISRRKN
jgi:methyl-accepting chemotaxis protein